jgi:tellurite resistance protein TehA-like permease
MNGVWLMIVVSTQSLAILTSLLLPHINSREEIAFVVINGFLLGLMFYIIFITIIFYRLTFYPLKGNEFTPPDWIDMGAAAITTLSGATLVHSLETLALYPDIVPFIKAASLLAWAISTWWIPMIAILEIWHHVYKKVPVTYHPGNWSIVFPLGVYTVCTFRLSETFKLSFLHDLATGFIYIAWAAWLLTFIAMCKSILLKLKG